MDYENISTYLAEQPEVLVAYLFGSQVTKRVRPDSDVDIAVLLTEADSYTQLERRLILMNRLEDISHKSVDVVVLNNASPLLSYEVLKHRHILFERDQQTRIDFEVRVGQIYADLIPVYSFFQQVLFQRIEEGKFGKQRHQWRINRTLENG